MKPEKSRTPVGITLLLIGIYIIVILLLFWFNILKVKDLVQISTVALGWLIALLIAIIHLNRARKDSQEAKEYEIKKKLEIEAYKEVNKSINDFSGTINSVLTLFFTSLDSKLKLHFQFPKFIPFDRIQIDQEIAMTRINLYNGNTKFLLAIEANEIAIIEYDFYRKYINFETDDLYNLLSDFISYFSEVKTNTLKNKQNYDDFKKRCSQISEQAFDIISYLSDYRIILMNSILEEIFGKSVPHRKPLDPKCKLLTEVAIKGEVEKEQRKRELASIKKNTNKTV